LPFFDAQLVSHEPLLLRLLEDFVAAPLQHAASSPYPEARQSLVAARVASHRARADLNALQTDIARQRAAGDLDGALASQQRLVGR
jgi:hypothetical protein